MGVAIIEKAFPKIRKEGYKIASTETVNYNCFGWAIHDASRWWSPIENNGYHWPESFSRDLDVGNYVKLFQSVGNFKPCQNGDYEDGFEKIAIYANSQGHATHAARQISSRKWTSKLGDWEDVEHDTLEALEGDFYGKVVQILKRAVQ